MEKRYADMFKKDDNFLNALAEAFRLQELILNTTELAIVSVTPEGIITSFNKSAEKMFGYKGEDLIGKSSPIIFCDLNEIIRRAQELSEELGYAIEPVFDVFTVKTLGQRSPYQEEWTLIRKDGSRFPAKLSISALRDDHDTVIGFIGIPTDLSEQKKYNERARISEEKLQNIVEENLRVFNNAVTLNAVAGFDGYFKRLSLSWSTMLGWTNDELKSKPLIEFVHPDDILSTLEADSYIKNGNNLFTFENRYRCKDGSYRWLLWGSAPDLNLKVIYSSAIDITERKKSEEQLLNSKKNIEAIAVKLQEQNRQLDEFAHIISHNLRSPVGNIQALIKLLDEKSSMEDYRTIFHKLKNVAKNLGETMNDLMDTLKAKTQSELQRVEIRFKEVLDKVVQSLEGDLIIAEASVTFDFNKAPTLNYPKAYLESIFQNLLSNAIKYRSPERKAVIHFESDINGNSVTLRVSDNGQGIDLEKFGDKLFGLHRTFHEHDQARGVGLFLVKTQIESMGGSIYAESEVGKGTTFVIRFN